MPLPLCCSYVLSSLCCPDIVKYDNDMICVYLTLDSSQLAADELQSGLLYTYLFWHLEAIPDVKKVIRSSSPILSYIYNLVLGPRFDSMHTHQTNDRVRVPSARAQYTHAFQASPLYVQVLHMPPYHMPSRVMRSIYITNLNRDVTGTCIAKYYSSRLQKL